MKVVDHRGRTRPWPPDGCRPLGTDAKPRSEPHRRARALLVRLFLCEVVLEEVPIPGTRLRGDFLIPNRRLAVEVHGPQHYEFLPFFHASKHDFLDGVRRDREKAAFYERNDISLVVLKHDGTDAEWEQALRG